MAKSRRAASGGSSRDRRRQRRADERATAGTTSTAASSTVELRAFPLPPIELAEAMPDWAFEALGDGTYLLRPAEHETAEPVGDDVLARIEAVLADAAAPVVEAPEPEIVPADPAPDVVAKRWTAVFVPEAEPTDDGRIMAPGAIRWRDLPLTLMGMIETPGEGGHAGAKLSGGIDKIWRAAGEPGDLILAAGDFDSGEFGQEIARLVEERKLRGLSVDLAIPQYEVLPRSQVLDDDGAYIGPVPGEERGDPDGAPSLIDILFGEEDEDMMFVVLDGVIGMATVCPFPAFARAEIALEQSAVIAGGAVAIPDRARWTGPAGFRLEFVEVDGRPLEGAPALTAAAAGLVPVEPPREWLYRPEPGELTPLTVTDDGQVYGHAAAWGTCHIGIEGVCVEPPDSPSGYSRFHLKGLACDGDGDPVDVGTITLDTGHADRRLDRQAATAHYDDTGTAVADVRVVDGELGIWVAGALRPDCDAATVRKLRGAVLSGDWRDDDGDLELVALLAVNVPGFPVPRGARAVVAAGGPAGHQLLSLTSAGMIVDPEERLTLERVRAVGLAGQLRELAGA